MNLLALMKDDSVKRIVTSGPLQDELTAYFGGLRNNFCNGKDEVPFDGRYNVDEDEILFVAGYPLAQSIKDGISNPLTHDILNLEDDRNYIKAIVCGRWTDTEKFVLFQTFDSRKLLSRKFTIINSNNTYTKLTDPGIVIDDKLDAVFIDDKILFCSYHNAKRIFDLSEYYREATNEDLNTFANSTLLSFEDSGWFVEVADSTMRKKIGLLQRNRVLEEVRIENIEAQARTLGIAINFVQENQSRKIKFPKDKKVVKELIEFLDENYFVAPLTQRKCKTNSKRYLE